MFYFNTNPNGFTLIELLVVLVLICLAMLAALSSYQNFAKRNQLQAAADNLVTTLNILRHQAVITQRMTSLCASDSGTACHGDWSDGVLAFIDINDDGRFDMGDKRLRVLHFPKGLQINWNRATKIIHMRPDGRLQGQNGSFYLRFDKSQFIKISVSLTGRVRIAKQKV